MIDELKTFIAVVEQKSFTKAAKLVSLSQPSVSLHIANLENHFHTKLIDRSNKQKAIVITPTGKMLYNRAKQMSLILKDTEEELFNYHNSLSGTLKLGASMTIGEFLLPSILGAFVKEFPHIKIEVTIENTFHIYDRFKKHQLDIALVEGTVPVDNYRHGNFYKDTMVVVVSKDHPLATEAVFSSKKSPAPTRENLITFLNNAGIYPKNFMILGSNYAIKEAVRNNLGISFISSLVVNDAVKNNELASLPVAFPYTRDFLYMIHPEDTISKAALLFLNRLLHYTMIY
ncbi:MAG: cysL [Clostridia bacterium]|nr:cysL [Clostridia bacterium]